MKILRVLPFVVLTIFLVVQLDFAKTPFQIKHLTSKVLYKNGCKKKLILKSGILFAFNSYRLNLNAKRFLNSISNTLENTTYDEIVVEGHTDNVGFKRYNMMLSKKRARAVANYLISKGIPKNLVKVVGYGESHPIYPNDSEKHRALNRRVEIKIYNSCKNYGFSKEELNGVVEVYKGSVYVVVEPNCRCRQSYKVLGDYKNILKRYAGHKIRVFGKVKRFSPWSGEIYIERIY